MHVPCGWACEWPRPCVSSICAACRPIRAGAFRSCFISCVRRITRHASACAHVSCAVVAWRRPNDSETVGTDRCTCIFGSSATSPNAVPRARRGCAADKRYDMSRVTRLSRDSRGQTEVRAGQRPASVAVPAEAGARELRVSLERFSRARALPVLFTIVFL